MFRRLFVCSCVLIPWLLCWTAEVRAQGCVPSNIPTNVISGFQILQPSQMPFAAVTAALKDIDGNNASHKMTIGASSNAYLEFWWKGYNVSGPLSAYYQLDNQGWQLWMNNLDPNGGHVTATFYPYQIGHIVHLKLVGAEKPGSGASTPTTQDIVDVTVTAQSPAIYYYDGNDSNVYWAITMSYSGVPEVSFADCPAMRTAHHTPTANLQLQNVSSGELRNSVSVTGPTELAGNTVQASVVDYISALPGATVTGTFGGVTFCDVDNINFFGIQSLFRIEGAKTIVADLGHPPVPGNEKPVPSAIYDVAPICQNNVDPCDWQATKVHSWAGRHQYWIGECQLIRAPDLDGVPWVPLCEFMNDASGAFGAGLIPTTIQLATGGLALPYPGPAPDLPIPGKCTKYPTNVLFSVGPKDLANWFKNIPN